MRLEMQDDRLYKYIPNDFGSISVIVPYWVRRIEPDAFSGSSTLKRIRLPDALKIICERAFLNCEALQEIIIPDGIETIGQGAFMNCSGLRKIRLPYSLERIEQNVFAGCSSLEMVEISRDGRCGEIRIRGGLDDSVWQELKRQFDQLIAPSERSGWECISVSPAALSRNKKLEIRNKKDHDPSQRLAK